MKKVALAILFLAMTAVTGSAFGQKPGNTVVTSTIADSDANFIPLSIQSDLLGAYLNGSDSVESQIQGVGDWELNMLGSATRRVNVNFDDLVAGSNPNNLPAPTSGYHPVRFITQCGVYGSNLLNLTTVGQTATCGMIVRVNIGSDGFSLRFYSQNFPGSDNISVACTAVASGKCSGWRTQSPNGTGKLIAQVYKVTTVKGKTVLTDYGKYRFSFDISFAK
ncbi:MAG: hypothetical protein ABR530_01270 [Pyrinomonadaceae bacterium]